MASKGISFVALFLSLVILISTEVVSARELTDASVSSKETKRIGEDVIGTEHFVCPQACCGTKGSKVKPGGRNGFCRCCS